jgi:hypothetical protein
MDREQDRSKRSRLINRNGLKKGKTPPPYLQFEHAGTYASGVLQANSIAAKKKNSHETLHKKPIKYFNLYKLITIITIGIVISITYNNEDNIYCVFNIMKYF